MSNRIRVLLVDDSVVIRRILTDALAGHPDVEVVGTASNGSIAIERVAHLHPDVVVMDVEMPVMDGLAALKVLRPAYPKMPIIMFSTLTGRGARATLEALAHGASDYVTKPANVGSVRASVDQVHAELVPRIVALSGRAASSRVLRRSLAVPRLAPTQPREGSGYIPSKPASSISAVVIGVSTGGPRALQEVLMQLPKDLRVPVLVVQHMPPVFTAQLASRLNSECQIAVVEAIDGHAITGSKVYLAPGDFHMEVVRRGVDVIVSLNQRPPEHSCRPAADVLFRSAASVWGSAVFGVVMTGMGNDGAIGAAAIVAAGGTIAIQDEASSVVWGMPGHVVRSGVPHVEIILDRIGSEIAVRSAADGQLGSRRERQAEPHQAVTRP